MLAAELRLHDVRVLVLEKETEPAFFRIVGLHIRWVRRSAAVARSRPSSRTTTV